MNQDSPDSNPSFSEPEEYFNEITRDFIIHENIIPVPTIENEVSIKTNIIEIPTVPAEPIKATEVTEPIAPTLPPKLTQLPEIIEDRLKKISKKSRSITSLNFGKKIYIGGALLIVVATFMVWTLAKPTPTAESLDTWSIQLDRPLLDLFPEYQDWPEVEKDYEKAMEN